MTTTSAARTNFCKPSPVSVPSPVRSFLPNSRSPANSIVSRSPPWSASPPSTVTAAKLKVSRSVFPVDARAFVRHSYLAAFNLVHNVNIKKSRVRVFADSLKTNGKATKVVLTACTRKLLVSINTMLKTNSPWNSKFIPVSHIDRKHSRSGAGAARFIRGVQGLTPLAKHSAAPRLVFSW